MTLANGCASLSSDASSQQALATTTANALSLDPKDVKYAGCSATSQTVKKLGVQEASSVAANMDVAVPLSRFANVSSTDATSVTKLFDSLQKNIVKAVTSGNFTKMLQETSAKLGATATANVQITVVPAAPTFTIQFPPTYSPTPTPSTSTNKESSDTVGIIVGSVIGGLAFLACVFFAVFAYMRHSGKGYYGDDKGIDEEGCIDADDVSITAAGLYPSGSADSIDTFGREKERTTIIIPDANVVDSWSPCCA